MLSRARSVTPPFARDLPLVHDVFVHRCLAGRGRLPRCRLLSKPFFMTDSLSQWLALREAADWSARSERLVQSVRDALTPADTVRALDLCTGTGSNLRYLLDRIPGPQRWLAVDRDPALLDEVPARLSTWAKAKGCIVTNEGRISHVGGDRVDIQVETRELNLERPDAAIFEGRNLVTASALLDLVSESWLRML